MNILILGGAGFIGQHLTHELLKTRNNRVVVIDSLKTSNINLDDFAEYKNLFEFIEHDITLMDDSVLFKLINKAHVVYHFAGSVGVEYIDKHPADTLFNNVALMNKLVPLFQKAKTHVVFASTSEVYGDADTGTFAETDNASIGPSSKLRWGYATSKLMMEFMITASNIPHTIVRFFNVVGPGQVGDYGMVLPRFVAAAKKNQPLVVYGNGQQVRCFCHIADAVTALVMLPTKASSGIYNIGNDIPITIEALARTVIRELGSESDIDFIPYERAFSEHHGDIKRRVPNINKLKALGYSPTRSITDIIRDMS